MSESDIFLKSVVDHATNYLDHLPFRSVAATATLAELRQRLSVGVAEDGLDPSRVIDDLVAATDGGHLGSASGRFFAWVIGGALPSALGADWLASTWDNNAALYACGPASAVVEEVAGDWIKQLLDLPQDASFAFTTGCQMAHFTCLAAARHALLLERGWNVEAEGLSGAPPIRVLATEHRHGSIDRALRFLGLGANCLVPLETCSDSRLRAATLETALARSTQPTIVVLDAADLIVGAVDPFDELIPVAHKAHAWVHVDGAFGLWARVSATHRDKVKGAEMADSWATDAHKWLNTPKDSGIAIVRNKNAHRGAMAISAAYLSSDGDARDQIDWTPDWTRRARGFAIYAAIRELGRNGIENLIDRSCQYAAALTNGIGAIPGGKIVASPTLNQGLVRFLHPSVDATDGDHNAWTDHIIAAINKEGTAFFSGSTWHGKRVMRISVVNWRTNSDDVEKTLEAVALIVQRQMELVNGNLVK